MKKLVVIIFVMFFNVVCFGQIAATLRTSTANELSNIQRIMKTIDDMVDEDKARGEKPFYTENAMKINTYLDSLNLMPLEKNIKTYIHAYVNEGKRFISYTNSFSNVLTNRNHIQIATYQTRITGFRNSTDNLIIFIISLPTTPNNELLNAVNKVDGKANTLLGETKDIKVKESSIAVTASTISATMATSIDLAKAKFAIKKSIDSVTGITNKAVEKVFKKDSLILELIKPQNTPKAIVGINIFDSNAIGVFYYYTFPNSKEGLSKHIGIELVVPAGSTTIKNPGGFVLYGLRSDRVFLAAGAGFLNNSRSQNISWKCDAMYLFDNESIGLTYSPLTNIGLQLAFRL